MDARLFILIHKDSINYNEFDLNKMCYWFTKYRFEDIVIGNSNRKYSDVYSDVYKEATQSLPNFKDFLEALKYIKNNSEKDIKSKYPQCFL